MAIERKDTYLRISLGLLTTVALFFILIQLKSIIIPFFFALLLTQLTSPLIERMRRWKIPKSIAILIVFFFLAFFLFIMYILILSSSRGFAQEWSGYAAKLGLLITGILQPLGYSVEELLSMIDPESTGFNIASIVDTFISSGFASGVIGEITSFLGNIFLVLLLWLFMSGGKEGFEKKLEVIFKGRDGIIMASYSKINSQVQSYILIKTLVSLLTGVMTAIIVVLVGGDFAILWGLLAFMLNYIPNFGSIVSTAFPALFLFLKFGADYQAILGTVLILINQNVIGNYLEPVYLGKHLNLSTVFVLVSLLFWGWVWGVWGMFLAVPLAAICVIIFENIESLSPLAVLLGGKIKNLEK